MLDTAHQVSEVDRDIKTILTYIEVVEKKAYMALTQSVIRLAGFALLGMTTTPRFSAMGPR